MPYPIRPFTEGMTPVPLSAEAKASYPAARASRLAMAEVFKRNGSIQEAQRAGNEAYRASMAASLSKPSP